MNPGAVKHDRAKSFGFHTCWINHAGAPLDALDGTPDHTIARLTDLAALADYPAIGGNNSNRNGTAATAGCGQRLVS